MGKVYHSPRYASMRFICRPPRAVFVDGVQVDQVRALVADFATHGGEYEYENPDGNIDRAAVIHGHYFDLDAQAEQKEWTDEEKDIVEKRMDYFCKRFPGFVQLWSAPAAPKPWPTYDETHHLQIANVAKATGMAAEALVYEEQNANRKGVIKQLNDLLAVAPPVTDEIEVEAEEPELLPAA